ncbi:MAG: Signal peptidase [Planctomycetota bacterium]|jgi:signal peptidase I
MAKKIPTMGPVRANLEAFGVAILAAVLLKWFCLEAYQIPTSSMQPTLMGSSEAEVYDRILVDKILPTFREPQRWDVTVFQYPLQKNQNYVKRIVGMPNDRLHIAGGNVYLVTDQGGQRSYAPLRKPADLQEEMWKNVYPARALVRGDGKVLGESWSGSPTRAFREDADGFEVKLEGSLTRLYFRDTKDGGFVDRVWDGYPTDVAVAIRNKVPHTMTQEIVVDARLAADITVSDAAAAVAFEIDVSRPGRDKWTYALAIAGGKARLQVRAKDSQVLAESAEFDCPLPAGTAVPLAFAHVDDMLLAWRDGEELMRLDTAEWACREGCVIADGSVATPQQSVVPQITFKGSGTARIAALRLDRDQHYTRDQSDEVVEVPEGHYYMMGDNTLQSIDSRGWTAISVGVLDGKVVPPNTPGARIVRGNKRPMNLAEKPDRDETPIAIPSENAIVMIDEFGEILRLEGQPGLNWGPPAGGGPAVVSFKNPDGEGEWIAPEVRNASGVSFVRRQDIQGRALMVFYPSRPISWLTRNAWPNRFGFVR